MELIESIRNSFYEQLKIQGIEKCYPSDKYYIDELSWFISQESSLFWCILYNSYYRYGVYDYLTLIKIYLKFGIDGFKLDAYVNDIYRSEFDEVSGTLTIKGLEELLEELKNIE